MSSRRRILDKLPCTNAKCGKKFKIERGKQGKCPHCGRVQDGAVAVTADEFDRLTAAGVQFAPQRVDSELSAADATRVRRVYDAFGHLTDEPGEGLEAFELTFMKTPEGDTREGEIETWERSAVIFYDYMEKHPETPPPTQRAVASMVVSYTIYPPDRAKEKNGEFDAELAGRLHQVLVDMGAKDCR